MNKQIQTIVIVVLSFLLGATAFIAKKQKEAATLNLIKTYQVEAQRLRQLDIAGKILAGKISKKELLAKLPAGEPPLDKEGTISFTVNTKATSQGGETGILEFNFDSKGNLTSLSSPTMMEP